jgi:hypothetical protein
MKYLKRFLNKPKILKNIIKSSVDARA